VTQLDLFGLSTTQQRHVDALTCLRDAMSDALEVVVNLEYRQDRDTRAPRLSGSWAFCVCRAGLRFEHVDEWGNGARDRGEVYGFDRTPARLATWAELSALVGCDPRRAEIASWVNSLPEPRWRLLMRPHELWPEPEGWHISYLCHDHVHEQWTVRRRCWQLVRELLNDAIDTVAVGSDGAA
jgi:hypothetical protein